MKRTRSIPTNASIKSMPPTITRCVYDEAMRIAEAIHETIQKLLHMYYYHLKVLVELHSQ